MNFEPDSPEAFGPEGYHPDFIEKEETNTEHMIQVEMKILKELRERSIAIEEEYKQAQILFKTQYAELLEKRESAKQHIIATEKSIRDTAIKIHQATGNKKLSCGVKIRLMINAYYDDRKAFEWAMEHAIALKLDAKVFEEIAKTRAGGSKDMDFVELMQVPQATIPQKIVI